MPARDILRRHWPAITIAVTALAIGLAAMAMVRSMPPQRIIMATGPEGGIYDLLGKRYRAVLARDDVEVQLVRTPGSVENLDLLRDPHSGVSVALVQGGVADAENAAGLESLGTVCYEPLWWFRRREIEGVGVDSLRGRKISIGPERSGTHVLVLELFKRAGIEQQVGELLPLDPRVAAEKLLAGEIDVAFMTGSWESAVVQQLLTDERVALHTFPRTNTLVALYPFLNRVVVPRGAANFAKDQPPSDVAMIATKASLVVRKDLHSG